MSTSIIYTKFHIPTPRAGMVRRQRLTERLNSGLDRKLTLISAPAGYGKTMVVCEWLAACGRPAAWLALEQGDSEVTRFLTYMITALRTVADHIGEGALAVLHAPGPTPTESILTALLNELAAIPFPFILVLDDYHAASSREVDEAIDFLLDHLPPQMHLVLTSRETPAIALARLRTQDQLTELRIADLRFTITETDRLLNHIASLNLTTDQIVRLHSQTEGWAAGLRLAAISIGEDQDADRLLQSFTGNHRFVLDYLAEEVLERQPEAVQRFLLQTSILDRLCGSLCDAVMRNPEISGYDMLIELERNNLFVIPLDQERRWYRYHHLFADILRRRLSETTARDNISALHLRASIWHEDHRLEMEAFHHAIEAGDIARSTRLLRGNGMPLHLRGAARLTIDWLDSLPAEELDKRPELWVFYGSALLIAGKPTRVERMLRAAESALGSVETDRNVELYGNAGPGGVVESGGNAGPDGVVESGGSAEQDADAMELLGWIAATRAAVASLRMTSHQDSVQSNLHAAEAAMQASATEDKTDELVEWITPARNAGSRDTDVIDEVIVHSRRALACLRPDNLPARTASAWMLGVACHRRGDYAAACEAYNTVIANAHLIDHQLMAVIAFNGIAQIKEAEGRPDLAAASYRNALRRANGLPHPAVQEAQAGLERVQRALAIGLKGGEALSRREIEVLQLIAEGLSNREIAEKLSLALDTVKGHNRRIYEKLQVRRRTEAIARAREWRLIHYDNEPKRH